MRISPLAALLALCAAPAGAQVRVIVDGRVQEVPAGVIRTISYQPGGRQTVRDVPFRGRAAPGAATITTTETSDEDEHGRTLNRSVETRIEPVAAPSYVVVAEPPAWAPPPGAPYPVDDIAPTEEPAAANDTPLRIPRDPVTGHFIAAIRVNGVRIRAIVDTGATNTILSRRDAEACGAADAVVDTQRMAGIGGLTVLEIARLRSLEIGGQRFAGLTAAIGQSGLSYSLLGQTEISRLGRIVIEGGTMTITPRANRLASR